MRHRLPLAAAAIAWAGMLAAIAWAGPAAPGEPLRLPPPGSPAWEAVELPGVERPTRYQALEIEGVGAAFRADADCSASGLVAALPEDFDLEATPLLRWRWQAERVAEGPDERSKPGDDFAARVSVMFPFEPERASWLERARNVVAAQLAGRAVPGSALYFVWTSQAPPGTAWKSPYGEEIELVALERGAAEDWRDAEVDVVGAYRRAFGRNPPRPAAVGLMSDSDNHCGQARAWYAGLEFHAPR